MTGKLLSLQVRAPVLLKPVAEISGKTWFNVESPLTLAQLQGRPVLLEYWTTWCPHCLSLIPQLNELQNKWGPRGLVVIGITQEPADIVSGYISDKKIRYAVCADGQIPQAIGGFPYSILIDSNGQIVYQGNSHQAFSHVYRLMRDSQAWFPPFIVPGKSIGHENARPQNHLEYTFAKYENIRDKPIHSESELKARFEFYWKNLPIQAWSGDVYTRSAAINDLADYFRTHSSWKDAIRQETIRRIQWPEPSWPERSALIEILAEISPHDEAEALEWLSTLLKQEQNPRVALTLEKALEKLDSRRQAPVIPPSLLKQAQKELGEMENSWRVQWFGWPAEFREYIRYRDNWSKNTQKMKPTPELLSRLKLDYQTHSRNTKSDILIRYFIIDGIFGDLSHRADFDLELWPSFLSASLNLLEVDEPDWYLIEYKSIILLSEDRIDRFDRSRLNQVLDRLLSSEINREVKASLQYRKFLLTDCYKTSTK